MIQGDGGDDQITLSGTDSVGTGEPGDEVITILGGLGNDSIVATASDFHMGTANSALFIAGGDGDDLIQFANGGFSDPNLDRAHVTINAGRAMTP